MNLETVQGDLLDQDVDVIVNAWNRNVIPWWLLLPQGVSGAIKRLRIDLQFSQRVIYLAIGVAGIRNKSIAKRGARIANVVGDTRGCQPTR